MIAQLKVIANELWGLFVDDALLAGLALAWIALALAVVRGHAASINASALAALFAAGLLGILAASVVRAAWRARGRRPDRPGH